MAGAVRRIGRIGPLLDRLGRTLRSAAIGLIALMAAAWLALVAGPIETWTARGVALVAFGLCCVAPGLLWLFGRNVSMIIQIPDRITRAGRSIGVGGSPEAIPADVAADPAAQRAAIEAGITEEMAPTSEGTGKVAAAVELVSAGRDLRSLAPDLALALRWFSPWGLALLLLVFVLCALLTLWSFVALAGVALTAVF